MDAPGLRDLQARIEAAYRTLIFLESRSVYDRQLLGSGALREDQVRGLHAKSAPGGASAAAPAGATVSAEPVSAPAAMSQDAALELAGGHVAPPAIPAMPTPAAVPSEAALIPPASAAPEPSPVPDSPATGAAARLADSPDPVTPSPEPDGAAEKRPAPESGAGLREERQRLRLAIETIAEKTKIRRAYLEAIEEERFGDLPAAVFVRGFLREYARCLGLSGDEVARNYMKRYRDWQESKGQPSGPASPFSHN